MENCGMCRCMSIAVENGNARCVHFSEVKEFMEALSSSEETEKAKKERSE